VVNQTRNRIQILERCKFWFLYRLYQFSNTYVRNFDRTARGIRRHRRHLVNGTETTTQRSQGRIRKCKTSLYLLPVLVDKVSQIRDNITETLRTSASRPFAARPHCGPDMSAFQPETEHEVRRLLCTMPAKSSPIDVLPCSLLKTCGDVFATAIVKLANWYISVMLQASASSATAENAGLHTLSPENYRPISNLGIISKVIERLLLARLHPTYLVPGISASSSRHVYYTGSSIRRRPHCWKSWPMRTRQPTTSKSPFSSASAYLQPSTR